MRTLLSVWVSLLLLTEAGSGPWIRWAPLDSADEMRPSTRVLDAVFTSVGGGDVGSAFALRADFSASMKAGAMDALTKILSVAMQIWPDFFFLC